MARPKTISGTCSRPGCAEPIRSRIYCATHFEGWRRKYAKDRCDWPDCRTIVAKDEWHQERRPKDGKLRKIDGRTMDTGSGRLGYCRRHEVEHLRASPEIEQLNLKRLGYGLEADRECWLPRLTLPSLSNGAGTFDPEGSNGKLHWPYHRAVWDLLMGGHRQRQELDHLTECAVQARCANPAHMQPVTHLVNMARRKARNAARKGRKHYAPITCGPPINWEAARAPAVVAFAREFRLPLPTNHEGRPQVRRSPPT